MEEPWLSLKEARMSASFALTVSLSLDLSDGLNTYLG